MKSGWAPFLVFLAVLLTAALSGACAGAELGANDATPAASLVRTDDGRAGVTVQAEWLDPSRLPANLPPAASDYPVDRHVLVRVKLDTHSVDLARYDLAKAASLTDGEGTSTPAVAWIGIDESGHHRDGLLAFPGSTNERWAAEPRRARLTLTGIAEPGERVFEWKW